MRSPKNDTIFRLRQSRLGIGFLPVAMLMLLASCGSGDKAADAQNAADVLTGDAQGAASDNPVCKLYSPGELTNYLGQTPRAGENAGVGSGCQWSATDDADTEPAFVQIQIVPAAEGKGHGAVPSGVKGYREAPELGKTGYVAPDVGWEAGAFSGDQWIGVTISGAGASEAKVIALFKDVLKRRAKA